VCILIRIGHDFRWLTKLEVHIEEGKRVRVSFEKIDIVSTMPEYVVELNKQKL
jgi:hypothetical protein